MSEPIPKHIQPREARRLPNVGAASCRTKGAKSMLGFAATFRATRTTEEWMRELREGEAEDVPRVFS